MTRVQRLSSSDLEHAAKLLARVAAPAKAYRQYEAAARRVADACLGSSTRQKSLGRIIGYHMRYSTLFDRSFLVAFTDWGAHLPAGARLTDAFTWVPDDELLSEFLPPVVLLPVASKHSKDAYFKTIIEHEFVHVNQAIRGRFPGEPKGTAAELLENLVESTRAEYEANFIQYARWPEEWFRRVSPDLLTKGLSFERWCIVRGYSQRLEHSVAAAAAGKLELEQFYGFLTTLRARLPDGFRKVGLKVSIAEELAANLRYHLITACETLSGGTKTLDPAYEALLQRLGEYDANVRPTLRPSTS
jgi:hypothetical protein